MVPVSSATNLGELRRWSSLGAPVNIRPRRLFPSRRFAVEFCIVFRRGESLEPFGGTRESSAYSGRDYQRGVAWRMCPIPTLLAQGSRARFTIGATISAVA